MRPSNTLCIIATPTELHVPYAIHLASAGYPVLIEKPPAANAEEVKLLVSLAALGLPVFLCDHKIATAQSIAFLAEMAMNPAFLREVHAMRAWFLEKDGIAPGRDPDDGFGDCTYHLLAFLFASFRAAGLKLSLRVDGSAASMYERNGAGGFEIPTRWTATWLSATANWAGHRDVPVQFIQAKAARADLKLFQFLGSRGEVLRAVNLGESGWLPHARVLRPLVLRSGDPETHHALADAVEVMRVIDAARVMAWQAPSYRIHTTPDFLRHVAKT